MSTASTKSSDRKREAGGAEVARAGDGSDGADASEISPLAWRIASLSVLTIAAFIRLYELGLKPMHHDEGVNGFFLTNLFRKGVYHYDPANYHGPTLYYFALLVTKLNALLFGESAGLSTNAVRLVPVIFGVATVWLVLSLRRNIGTVGALAAASFVALSPGHVYISRYFIHEAHFVFFTLGVVVASMRYYESADPLYLLLASLSAALLFATKETAIISAGVLIIAYGIATAYLYVTNFAYRQPKQEFSGRKKRSKKAQKQFVSEETMRYVWFSLSVILGGVILGAVIGVVYDLGTWKLLIFEIPKMSVVLAGVAALLAAISVGIDLRHGKGLPQSILLTLGAFAFFIFINILFYSSFFSYGEGVKGALESVQVWARTGTKEHAHPLFTYLKWLWQEEAALLTLGAAGAVIALILRRNRFAVFAGAWAFGILAAYSLIPYKTPWLMINFTVPLAIIAGYAINELYNFDRSLKLHFMAGALATVALVVLGLQAVSLNFYHYDDDQYPYVYAHTQRGFLQMIGDIESLSKRAGTGTLTGITITSPEYWPLPWYLRDYEHAGFFGHMAQTNEPLVLGSLEQMPELDAQLGDRYQVVNSYALRPGVTLVLYAKKELAGP